jgi:CheY-like chemotaxis protein
MLDERDKIEGDLVVVRDTRLYGLVTGSITVKPAAKLILHGMIGGSLFLESESAAEVYGTVFGDVVNHGGKLRVWSTGTIRGVVDRGSSTRIEAGAKVRALVPGEVRVSPPPDSELLNGFRVLVVEDDEATLDELVALLKSCSAKPVVARQGEEALEVFRRERPELIVADLWIPKSDGYDFLRHVRELPIEEGRLTPAVAMTASTSDTAQRALLAGFQAYLAKPFDPEDFIALLRAFYDANQRP